jgi:hypothetical protein
MFGRGVFSRLGDSGCFWWGFDLGCSGLGQGRFGIDK